VLDADRVSFRGEVEVWVDEKNYISGLMLLMLIKKLRHSMREYSLEAF
jgi:hypothetical protein